jgi:hypothetical protein
MCRALLARRHRDDAKSGLGIKLTGQPGEFFLSRYRASCRIASVFAIGLATAVGGCSSAMFDKNEGGFFSKPVDIFHKPDWARPGDDKSVEMGKSGSVGPDDLVSADGRCSGGAQAAAEPSVVTPPPADNAAGAPVAAPAGLAPADASAPTVLGGVALGMTECQTVQRAGLPGTVNISAGEKGERVAVLTYLSGPWPGIYHFSDGRLKEVDRAPEPPAPPKAPPKKKTTKQKPAGAKTSQR